MSNTTSQSIDYLTLVAESEGSDYPFFEHDAYEFSRKTFREDDRQGVYEGEPYSTGD